MKEVYQFKITIADSTPPIWRRVLVPSDYRLHQFHHVIQNCFSWYDCHLYAFYIAGTYYDDDNPALLSKKLTQLELSENQNFQYIYDFGDNWTHKILLEKILHDEESLKAPKCTAGKRGGPLEDSGGIWGYEDKLTILADNKHPEHAQIRDWMGKDFDPNLFDINSINTVLAKS
jgi:Plasmid pRiA4b ORF-3-like protein